VGKFPRDDRGGERNQRDHGDDEQTNDGQGCHEAPNSEPFEPVGQRIEKISKHEASDERQQDLAQQHGGRNDSRAHRNPEHDWPRQVHG
jgi:hypothetical protein